MKSASQSVIVCTAIACIGLAQLGSAQQVSQQQAATAAGAKGGGYEDIRTATARFQDLNVALKEGYIRDPTNMCVTAAMEGAPKQLGAMGVHYFRPDLLGLTAQAPRVTGNGTHTDFSKPAVLIYEPQADGRMVLVAIENLVWVDAWQAKSKALPAFEGNEYYRMVDNPATPDVDEAHGFMPHFELHMWLYKNNPNGMFAPFNPGVTCDHHRSTADAAGKP